MLNLLSRLRRRASDEGGFTLIELLVVILIIGILAAIAIPLFLNQTQKANDSSAESLVRNAATEASTYATNNSGSFAELSTTKINGLEKSIPVGAEGCAATEKAACLIVAKPYPSETSTEGYRLTAEAATTKNQYTLTDNEGVVTRTCTKNGKTAVSTGETAGACVGGSW